MASSEVALCMPSVVSTFTRHPGPSRIITTDDEALNKRLKWFSEQSCQHYEELKVQTITSIMDRIIRLRLTFNGELIQTLDTKTTLINAIKRDDIQFFKRHFKNISNESLYHVDKKLYETFLRPNQIKESISSITLEDDK